MNGLMVLELKRPGFMARLLGRRVKENVAVELNNYVAATPLPEITRGGLERILGQYGCDHADVKPTLALIYAQVLRHFSEDTDISEEERGQLNSLKGVFGLSDEEIREIEREVVLPIFQREMGASFSDGHLTPAERERLRSLSAGLRLDENEAESLIFKEAYRVFLETTSRAKTDSPAPAGEERN